MRILAAIVVSSSAASCHFSEHPGALDGDARVRRHLANGDFYAAMRSLPEAMEEWGRAMQESGNSFEGASSWLSSTVFANAAVAGDRYWGKILDDPEIPYGYKTMLIFEILDARLGKGSVLLDGDRLIVPTDGPTTSDW